MEESKMKEAIGQDVIMQSVLGKLYDILTMGEDDTPKGNQDFFCWASPGIPVLPSDFDYMTEGFAGKLRPEDLKKELKDLIEAGAIKSSDEIDKQAIIDRLVANDIKRKDTAAYNFFNLVNFIPDTSGTSEDGFTTYRTYEHFGSLSELYYYILLNCSVRRNEQSEKTKERIEEYRKLLYKSVEKPAAFVASSEEEVKPAEKEDNQEKEENQEKDIFDMVAEELMKEKTEKKEEQESSSKTESENMDNYQDWVITYFEKKAAYEQAVIDYANARAQASVGNDQVAYMAFQKTGTILRKRITDALRDWEGAGRKSLYEKLTDSISILEKGDMTTLLASYINTMENDKLHNADSTFDYYYTSLSPASFANSDGWTKFSFDFDKTSTTNITNNKNFNSTLKTESSSFFHKHNTTDGKKSNSSSIDFSKVEKKVTISFEMCQVNIVRPWFHQSLLTSRNWRFKQSGSIKSEELLSDGKTPPSGILPAYPTSVIFIRNLSLKFHDSNDAKKIIDDYNQRTRDYSGNVNIGFFGAKAGASYMSDKDSTDHDETLTTIISDQEIKVKGMQIIGYKCHLLGLSPNPDPSITAWLDGDE